MAADSAHVGPSDVEGVSSRPGLSPAQIATAATRWGWLSLGAAVALPAAFLLQGALQPSARGVLFDEVNRLVLLATVFAAAGLFALHRSRVIAPSMMLRLGMALEIVVSLAVSLIETSVGAGHPSVVLGTSAVAPWLLAVGAFVPNYPRWTLITGLMAASMWPVAYAISTARLQIEVSSWGSAVWWPIGNYFFAVVAYLFSRSRYRTSLLPAPTDEVGGYHLVSRIGEGGMGEVWRAAHSLLARPAAIKIVRPELAGGANRQADAMMARFRREADLIARLQSPHTVQLYDFGTTADGRLYYAMELLDGISAQTLIERYGPVSPARAVWILMQVCRSLHEAHERGLIHRDLKPSNIMVCEVALEHDVVKVLDFGLAKGVVDIGTTQLTVVGATTGTPGYIAPEIALGDSTVDRRADIYSLGCVAYFLLTGTPVFDESNPTRLTLLHVQQEPEPPSRRTSQDMPSDLERLILACLAKKTADRPASAAEVMERLASCGAGVWTTADARRWWDARAERAG